MSRQKDFVLQVFSRRDSHLSCLLNKFWAGGTGIQLKVLHFAGLRPRKGQSPPCPQRCRPCSKAEGGPSETPGWELQSPDGSLQLLCPTLGASGNVYLPWDAAEFPLEGSSMSGGHRAMPILSGSRFERISAKLLSCPSKQTGFTVEVSSK